jgi:hypothetical protein
MPSLPSRYGVANPGYGVANFGFNRFGVVSVVTSMPKSLPLADTNGHGSSSGTWRAARRLPTHCVPLCSCLLMPNSPSLSRSSSRPHAIMIPFHKLALVVRNLLKDPRMRPITIDSLLCRFFVRTLLRMNKIKRKRKERNPLERG